MRYQNTLPMKMKILRNTLKDALSEGYHNRNALFKRSLGSVFLLSIRRVQSEMIPWVS